MKGNEREEWAGKNILANFDRDHMGPIPAHNAVASVVGGGPSAAKTYGQLRENLYALNHAGKWLFQRGISPITVACDPSPNIVGIACGGTFLLASRCPKELFDKVEEAGGTAYMWNMLEAPFVLDDPVGGGTTIGTRILFLLHMCGFRSVELHGYDSSSDGDIHVYGDRTEEEFIYVDTEQSKYRTTHFMHKQAMEFMNIDIDMNISFFGGGLLPALWGVRW